MKVVSVVTADSQDQELKSTTQESKTEFQKSERVFTGKQVSTHTANTIRQTNPKGRGRSEVKKQTSG